MARASVAPAAGVVLLWTAIWGAQGDVWARFSEEFNSSAGGHNNGRAVVTDQHGAPPPPPPPIDRSRDEAWSKLTPADRAELDRLADNEIATSNWFGHRALEFIWANPWLVLQGAFHKLEASFSWRLNPVREPLAQAVYFVGYVPIAVLGIVGVFPGAAEA